MDLLEVKRDDCTLLLQQVLASRTFSRSTRLAKFLETVCTLALEGRSREINEQQIGVSVFGRSPMYSAADDSIVRTQARLLRQRLEEYFEQENPQSDLVITIPRGGYVPSFEPRSQPFSATFGSIDAAPASVNPPPHVAPGTLPHKSRLPVIVTIALSLVAGTVLGAGARHLWRQSTDPLWTAFFAGGRSVLIVPSDDALVLLQEASRTAVTLDDYRNGSWLVRPKLTNVVGAEIGPKWLASHQYTSTADLNLALRLGRLPIASHATVESRNARDLRLDDLKQNNVVLIGGSGANPWVELFADRLNFSVHWDWQNARGYVLNKHPAAGEASSYQDDPSVSMPKSYGLLAYLPGIDGNGRVFLFEGTGMAGTEAAADFPFSDERFPRFEHTIGATAGHVPYFEVLLETTSLGGNAPEARIVAFRLLETPTTAK